MLFRGSDEEITAHIHNSRLRTKDMGGSTKTIRDPVAYYNAEAGHETE